VVTPALVTELILPAALYVNARVPWLESGGYVSVRNEGTKDGRWKVNGKNVAIYAKRELSIRDRIAAATDIARWVHR
jgi:hypothetical protein